MEMTEFIGYIASALTIVALLPQAIKCWRTKCTKDISLGMYVILASCQVLWIVYGFLIDSNPVIITNIGGLGMSFSILISKIKFG